jgi:hypothetical protein
LTLGWRRLLSTVNFVACVGLWRRDYTGVGGAYLLIVRAVERAKKSRGDLVLPYVRNAEPPYLSDVEFTDVASRLLRQVREDRENDGVALCGLYKCHDSPASVAPEDVTPCNVSEQAETASGDDLLSYTAVDGLARELAVTSVRAFDAMRDIALRLAFLADFH